MLPLLTEKEAARLLNLHPDTLRLWRYVGKGPRFVRLNGRVRYELRAIEEHVSKNTFQGTYQYEGKEKAA